MSATYFMYKIMAKLRSDMLCTGMRSICRFSIGVLLKKVIFHSTLSNFTVPKIYEIVSYETELDVTN